MKTVFFWYFIGILVGLLQKGSTTVTESVFKLDVKKEMYENGNYFVIFW